VYAGQNGLVEYTRGRDPRRLSEVLGELIPDAIVASRILAAARQMWFSILGQELGSHVKPVQVKNKALLVRADSSTAAAAFRIKSASLIAALRVECPGAVDEKFRVVVTVTNQPG